eukprot:767958-Hanusia_phi.AAC.1
MQTTEHAIRLHLAPLDVFTRPHGCSKRLLLWFERSSILGEDDEACKLCDLVGVRVRRRKTEWRGLSRRGETGAQQSGGGNLQVLQNAFKSAIEIGQDADGPTSLLEGLQAARGLRVPAAARSTSSTRAICGSTVSMRCLPRSDGRGPRSTSRSAARKQQVRGRRMGEISCGPCYLLPPFLLPVILPPSTNPSPSSTPPSRQPAGSRSPMAAMRR